MIMLRFTVHRCRLVTRCEWSVVKDKKVPLTQQVMVDADASESFLWRGATIQHMNL